MADTLGILAQSAPAAATLTDAYTVPNGASVVLSTILICNRSATPTSCRIALAKAGLADTPKQYILYDRPIGANETQEITVGITLGVTDVVRVYNTLATCSFNVFGAEVTA